MFWWTHIAILVVAAIPLATCRHISYTGKKAAVRHESQRSEEDRGLPRSHLRLHSRPPRALHMREGDSQVLECQAGGSPLPRVYWLKNGEQMAQTPMEDDSQPKGPGRGLNLGSTSARVYLDCVGPEDEGEYTCIAENAHHHESTTTRVTVASSDDKECRDRKQYGQAPRILSWTKTALEIQGRHIRVFCRAEGQPKPKIKWLNPLEEEIDAENSSKYELSSNGDLVIRNLKWRDMGNYVCVAENSHGSARAEAFIYPTTPET